MIIVVYYLLKYMEFTENIKKIIQEWQKDKDNNISINELLTPYWIILSEDEINNHNNLKKYILEIYPKKQKTKNQHYIPQLYLKKFTFDEKNICIFDNEKIKKWKTRNIKSICSWEYFYSINTGEEDITSQLLEDMFCAYENNFLKIYDNLVDEIKKWKSISDKNHYVLCEFISSLWIRWKYFRDEINNSQEDLIKEFNKKMFLLDKDKYLKESVDKNIMEDVIMKGDYKVIPTNGLHIDFMNPKTIEEFTTWFAIKKMRIYISDWSRNFITTDNPVISITPTNNNIFWWNHFCDRIHYFALSPNILVEFISPDSPWKKIKRKTIWEKEIIYFNFIRSRYAKYLYSKSEIDFKIEDFRKIQLEKFVDLQKLFPDFKETEKSVIDNIKSNIEKFNALWFDWENLIFNLLKPQWKQ